jgi:hypothetical protein
MMGFPEMVDRAELSTSLAIWFGDQSFDEGDLRFIAKSLRAASSGGRTRSPRRPRLPPPPFVATVGDVRFLRRRTGTGPPRGPDRRSRLRSRLEPFGDPC